MTYEDLKRLNLGVQRIGYKEFDDALLKVTCVSREYTHFAWIRFQDDPIGYMTSRNPESIGRTLFDLAWQKGADHKG